MENLSDTAMEKLRALVREKRESIASTDLLIPEIKWLIDCTSLTEKDRLFAELRYIQGMSTSKIMEKLDWYSTNTFTRHNKKVWARLVQTLMRLI